MVEAVEPRTGKGAPRSLGERIFAAVNVILILAMCIIFIYPFLSVLAKSLSNEADVLAGTVGIWPRGVHMNAYRYILSRQVYYVSFKNTFFVTAIGTALAMTILSLTAYPLSRRYFRGRKVYMLLIVFTMIFSAGLIPGFLVVKSLGLYDSLWALILTACFSPFNVIILKSFMMNISDSLEESARLDGANHFQVLWHLMLPLSIPSLATLCLFTAVGYWNDFFHPLIYLQTESKYTLQLYLRFILISVSNINTWDPLSYANTAPESIQNATIIVTMVPILAVYPFLQRYFVTGINLGAIKE